MFFTKEKYGVIEKEDPQFNLCFDSLFFLTFGEEYC